MASLETIRLAVKSERCRNKDAGLMGPASRHEFDGPAVLRLFLKIAPVVRVVDIGLGDEGRFGFTLLLDRFAVKIVEDLVEDERAHSDWRLLDGRILRSLANPLQRERRAIEADHSDMRRIA